MPHAKYPDYVGKHLIAEFIVVNEQLPDLARSYSLNALASLRVLQRSASVGTNR